MKAGDRTLAGVLGDCNKDCGWILSLSGRYRKAGERHRAAPSGLGPWYGARVASPRCPYPPPRLLQHTANHDHRTNHVSTIFSRTEGTKSSWLREPSQGSVIRANALRWVATRSRVRPVSWLYYNLIVHLEKEDCPRLDRGNLRPPICPATFRTETFATREGSPTEVSRGMDRGNW